MSKKLSCLIYFVLVLCLVGTSAAQNIDPSLVGCWKFDEGSGTIAYDSSGNGNDGTLVLAFWPTMPSPLPGSRACTALP
jgi:hypothetical protein